MLDHIAHESGSNSEKSPRKVLIKMCINFEKVAKIVE